MTHAMLTAPFAETTDRPRGAWKSLLTSFRWALEVRRRFNREMAAGRQPDGETIRRIVQRIADERLDVG